MGELPHLDYKSTEAFAIDEYILPVGESANLHHFAEFRPLSATQCERLNKLDTGIIKRVFRTRI